MDEPVSSRTKSAKPKPGRSASTSRVPEESTQIPQVETPTGNIELHQIWNLLREMQQQVVSLQESVGTVGQNLIEVEGTINRINNVTTGVAERLDRLENKPSTPQGEADATGTDETPWAPIHSPTACRPHERSSLLPPFPSGTSQLTSGIPGGNRPSSSARTSPEQKPLLSSLAKPATSTQPVKPPKMREPEDFDGVQGRTAIQWCTKALLGAACQAPNFENNELAIVTRLLMLMKAGRAADWAQPHLARLVGNAPGALSTIDRFGDAFKEAFGDPDAARVAARQIEALKQEGSVVDYTTQFENIRAELTWNEPALISQYERGLQHRVKTQLAFAHPRPTTLQEVQREAKRIGNLFAELDASPPPRSSGNTDKKGKGRKTPATNTTAKPDAKSSLPNYVEKEEREARRKEGLCIKCGAPDHTFKQCKNGYSVKRLSSNKGTETKKEETKKESGKVGETRKATVEEEEEWEESGKE